MLVSPGARTEAATQRSDALATRGAAMLTNPAAHTAITASFNVAPFAFATAFISCSGSDAADHVRYGLIAQLNGVRGASPYSAPSPS